MATGIVNGVAAVTYLSTLSSGQAVSNTFHITNEGSSPPDLATLNQLGVDLVAWLDTTYRATLTNGDTLQSLTVRQVPDPTAPAPVEQAVQTIALAGTRGGSGAALPQSACAVVKLKTPFGSRNSRGHMFLGPSKWATDSNGDNWLTAGSYMVAAIAYAAKLAAGASLSPTWTGSDLPSWSLCIYSKALELRSEPSVFICNAVVADPKVHWLRSRERGAS